MSTSNSKFRGSSKEAPTEPFKRSVSACLKAIAKKPELEVTFAAERPGLAELGKRVDVHRDRRCQARGVFIYSA